jgi:HEPN domain-containing protein
MHNKQAAEKALKALLLFHKIDFPLTHDIEELLEIIEGSGIAIPPDIEEAGMLTPYAVETRYPGYWGVISKADLLEAIDLSKRVMDWVKAQL